MPRRKNRKPHGPGQSMMKIGPLLLSQQTDLFKYQPIWELWDNAVGPDIAAHAQPEGIQRSGTLVVGVVSSVWMHELQFLKHTLIDSINQACRKNLVSDIYFQLSSSPSPVRVIEQSAVRKELPPECRIDKKTRESIQQAADGISDIQLRSVIERIAGKLSVRIEDKK